MFGGMLDRFRGEVVRILMTVQVRSEADAQAVEPAPAMQNVAYKHAGVDGLTGEETVAAADSNGNQPVVNQGPKLGRNDPCFCGSGKKYKNCHGRLD